MEKINVKVKNVVKNPKNNFLSYLYKSNGWKRIMLETSKECYINSSYHEEKIRIIITNTGNIMIEGNCIFDILIGIEFISKELEPADIDHITLDDKDISKEFTSIINISKYGYSNLEDEIIQTDQGVIHLLEDKATITYSEYENGKILKDVIKSVFDNRETIDNDTYLESESIVLIVCVVLFSCYAIGTLF